MLKWNNYFISYIHVFHVKKHPLKLFLALWALLYRISLFYIQATVCKVWCDTGTLKILLDKKFKSLNTEILSTLVEDTY